MLNKAVSDKAVGDMRKSAERMLAMHSPAVDEDWWRTMLAIVIEVQERRAEERRQGAK